jgi:aminopeptidase-like protein
MTSLVELSYGSPADLGVSLTDVMGRLFPICRSITGEGVRRTLAIVAESLPLEIHEVPSGTRVLDWTIPPEWNIRDAYVADDRGQRVIDFRKSNLHVVNYSVPVDRSMPLRELREHLHTLPEHPDWIPYVTSYYVEDWGFCLRQTELDGLSDGSYQVVIDSQLSDGSLTYGECFVAGRTDEEVLLTTHVCHPSLCNDNLSGIVTLMALGLALREATPRYSYRLLFIPGTIGAITWLARNQDAVSRVRHGLVLAGLGASEPLTYKRSRRSTAFVDRAATHVLGHATPAGRVLDFSPYGYDERQFCSPGFDLPVGRITRAEYGTYPEYHTSADDLTFVSEESLADSWSTVLEILVILETDRRYRNLVPFGEPQLGRRGLYDDGPEARLAMLWVLNLSDGRHSLLDIAERAGVPYRTVLANAERLEAAGLLERL